MGTLFDAIKNKDLAQVKELLPQGVTLSIKSPRGETLLYLAAIKGNHEVVSYLIDTLKYDPNILNDDGKTPIYKAIESQDHVMIRLFISYKADLWHKDNEGFSVLHAAAYHGIPFLVKDLITQRPHMLDAPDNQGWTPLFWATFSGQMESAMILLIQGANLRLKTTDDQTLLHLAAAGGLTILVKDLIAQKFDLNHKDQNGFTPLFYAVRNNHIDLVTYLFEAGASLTEIDKEENTLLHHATAAQDKDIITYLIEQELDIDQKNSQGESPLDLAATLGLSEHFFSSIDPELNDIDPLGVFDGLSGGSLEDFIDDLPDPEKQPQPVNLGPNEFVPVKTRPQTEEIDVEVNFEEDFEIDIEVQKPKPRLRPKEEKPGDRFKEIDPSLLFGNAPPQPANRPKKNPEENSYNTNTKTGQTSLSGEFERTEKSSITKIFGFFKKMKTSNEGDEKNE